MSSIETTFAKINTDIKGFMQNFADEFLIRVKEKTPVKTGRLQNAWEAEVTPDLITVSNDVPYAEFIEFGTPTISPFAMLQQTIAEAGIIADVVVVK